MSMAQNIKNEYGNEKGENESADKRTQYVSI